MDHRTICDSAIEQLYHDYHEPILRYLTRLVSQRETAEDLCHETFIKVLRHWGQHDLASVKSWLYRIAKNTAYDYLRRRQRVEVTTLIDDQAAGVAAPTLETQHASAEPVWAALQMMPEHYRLPLLLYAHAGYDLKDIAAALGCNVNTIKTRVHRARAQFRQFYVA